MYLSEANIRYEALTKLKEVQSKLVASSFLPAIALMKAENPLKKEVVLFQDELDDLIDKVAAFIKEQKNDIEYQPSKEEQTQADSKNNFEKIKKEVDKVVDISTKNIKDPEKVTESSLFVHDYSWSNV